MSESVAVDDLKMGQTVEHEDIAKKITRITYNTKNGGNTPFQYHLHFDDYPQLRSVKPGTQFTVLSDDDIAEEGSA